MIKAGRKIDNLAAKHYMCLRNCKECEYVCIKAQNHLDDHSCETSHKCIFVCEICTDVPLPCGYFAGHKGTHICINKKHTCKKSCPVPGCNALCILEPNHPLDCKCNKSIHECKEKCKMHEICKDWCKLDVLIAHTDHDCGQLRCPFKCIFDDGDCLDHDHFHDIKSSEIVKHPISGQPTKLHLCGKSHKCKKQCESIGVCYIQLNQTMKTYNNSYNEVIYKYVEQIKVKKSCSIPIPSGQLTHNSKHRCDKKGEHTCDKQCPDCQGYCNKACEHPGLHASTAHRNKEMCIYISTNQKAIERKIGDEDGSTLLKFVAGESAQPQHCDTCCAWNGRGHIHPILCPGPLNCLGKVHSGYAIHSNEKYYNGNSLDHRNYDLVECSTYWRLSGWEAPVFSINPKAQEILSRCNYYCSHESHSEVVFCENKLFHSLSENRSDHNFDQCSHAEFINHDIIFIIDITGSMRQYSAEVQKTMRKLRLWKAGYGKILYSVATI